MAERLLSMSNFLTVINPGVFTQIQDLGRYQQAKQGLSQGGVLDEKAASWANYLLGNDSNAPLLEISFGQTKLQTDQDIWLAITGADMNAMITDQQGLQTAQANNQSFLLKRGQSITFGFATSGVRAYLAVAGGLVLDKQFASVSTVARNRIGGLTGSGLPLQVGQKLECLLSKQGGAINKLPVQFVPDYHLPVYLGVIEAYQAEAFSAEQKSHFYQSEYVITAQSDRMGLRLQGAPIQCKLNGIVSEGIALGSIQIPADGLPIILLNDRQTLGGYPKMGCICRADLSRLAQLPVGTVIRFKKADLKVEQQRYRQQLQFFQQGAK